MCVVCMYRWIYVCVMMMECNVCVWDGGWLLYFESGGNEWIIEETKGYDILYDMKGGEWIDKWMSWRTKRCRGRERYRESVCVQKTKTVNNPSFISCVVVVVVVVGVMMCDDGWWQQVVVVMDIFC